MRAKNKLSAGFIRTAPAGKHSDGGCLWLIKREDGGAQWMQRVKTVTTLQKFVSYHGQIYNHFNYERHLETR